MRFAMKPALILILALAASLAWAQVVDTNAGSDLPQALGPSDPFGPEVYTLVAVKGAQASYRAQISFEGGRVAGQAPCNRFFADLTYSADGFVIGPVGATRMACPDLPAEVAFFELLGQVTQADRRKGEITLLGPEGALLHFAQRPD